MSPRAEEEYLEVVQTLLEEVWFGNQRAKKFANVIRPELVWIYKMNKRQPSRI